jgi:hypothetical protein
MTDDQRLLTAQSIIEANSYMTLATADAEGVPWASPVWFAHERYSAFLWVSRPGTRHSRNISVRPDVGIVIFDSTVSEDDAQAVYLVVEAAMVDEAVDDAMATFSRRSVARGGAAWGTADVTGAAAFRLYRARVLEAFILGPHDQRLPVQLTDAGPPPT